MNVHRHGSADTRRSCNGSNYSIALGYAVNIARVVNVCNRRGGAWEEDITVKQTGAVAACRNIQLYGRKRVNRQLALAAVHKLDNLLILVRACEGQGIILAVQQVIPDRSGFVEVFAIGFADAFLESGNVYSAVLVKRNFNIPVLSVLGVFVCSEIDCDTVLQFAARDIRLRCGCCRNRSRLG